MKRIVFSSIVLSLVLTLPSLSCFDPLDHFAVEVVLNKPDISYNLMPIEKANNVIVEDGVIVYRSHFDNRVAVLLEEINADLGDGNSLKGLSIRIQMPAKNIITSIIESELSLESTNIKQIDKPFIESLRYNITIENTEFQTNVYMKKDNVTFNIRQPLKVGEEKVAISLVVTDAESLDDKIKSELGQIIKSLGLDEGVLTKLESGLTKYDTENLVEAINIKKEEFDFGSAMKAELDWLRENSITVGIADDDIQRITEISKVGIAGWNSRIIYAKGKWQPFFESGFGMIRDGGANCGSFEPKKIPDGELELGITAIKQIPKAVIRWGEIKSLI